MTAPTYTEFAALVKLLLEERTDCSVSVSVTTWEGYGDVHRGEDDTWGDPVYVTVEEVAGGYEFSDAVCDLAAPGMTWADKVRSVVTDLIDG